MKLTDQFGTSMDKWRRVHLRRFDNEDRRQKVQKARKAVYNKLVAIDNKTQVECYLKPESLVLAEVSQPNYLFFKNLTLYTERLFTGTFTARLQCIQLCTE
jgi:hypothetical protein